MAALGTVPAPGTLPLFIVNGTRRHRWLRLFADGAVPETQFTGYSGHAVELSRAAAAAGRPLVVAVGGDGTLSQVVTGVMQHAEAAGVLPSVTTVGLVPLGTGSDFARSLGFSNDPLEALARISNSNSNSCSDAPATPISVLRLTTQTEGGRSVRYCINACSAGASGAAAPMVSRWRWLGATLAYMMVGTLALVTTPRCQAHLIIDDGQPISLPAMTLTCCGNGRYFAGGMQVCPGADPCSSTFQVTAINGIGVLSFARHQHQLRKGQLHNVHPGVSLHTAQLRAELRPAGQDSAASRHCLVECDGEAAGWLPMTVELMPAALRFCM